MEIQINCSRCGEKLMGYCGPDGVTLRIDPHDCAPAPMPEPPEGVVLQSPHEFLGIPEPAPVCAQCGAPLAEKAPEPDVAWVSDGGGFRLLAGGELQFQLGDGGWALRGKDVLATNIGAALAACVRALRAAVEYDNEPIGSKQELLADEAYNSALDESRALGVMV